MLFPGHADKNNIVRASVNIKIYKVEIRIFAKLFKAELANVPDDIQK